ncbi:FAD-dependent oxidoreductase (plasmid) [Lichenicola cladoniae]|uniref:FAD-dependent oxidoreductase n=1 Tax=Lichenicola cladoniae TaxID=1484109 RepID=A0A6M8HZM0_9PROT|nr:FAD/NAD(P)-binding protein [Lichenicola cladoniae]NPD69867.1 FAD-dependent oxidoreductase [Acetobacteraceae bacterium]QKE93842.1 FAD-dependent oxidoreductase [Lichenicola cladoniae]
MSSRQESVPVRHVVIVGAGFSGTLAALKLLTSDPTLHIHLVDSSEHVGRGLAYGACAPQHLLNVPVNRLEVGLTPGFGQWLSGRCDVLEENFGSLADAFLPRALFGDYMEERLQEALAAAPARLTVIRSEVVSLLELPRRGVLLRDGREIPVDVIVLATGNLPPRAPLPPQSPVRDDRAYVPDPWAPRALDGIDPDRLVVLVGTGLTMVDTVMRLRGEGHRGQIHAVSRRGLTPLDHRSGGAWPPFVDLSVARSPLAIMRQIRSAATMAAAQDVPWQRVIDAVRPMTSRIWTEWSKNERRRFLRHLRPYWDAHRHRLAPRVARRLHEALSSGSLTIWSGGIVDCRPRDGGLDVDVRPHGSSTPSTLEASRMINCTGPRTDYASIGMPLFADLRRRGLVQPDELALGIETDGCAACGRDGHPSSWLFAVGPLTRPAWWEITAVPEIAAQIDHFVSALTSTALDADRASLAATFIDLGAGI